MQNCTKKSPKHQKGICVVAGDHCKHHLEKLLNLCQCMVIFRNLSERTQVCLKKNSKKDQHDYHIIAFHWVLVLRSMKTTETVQNSWWCDGTQNETGPSRFDQSSRKCFEAEVPVMAWSSLSKCKKASSFLPSL